MSSSISARKLNFVHFLLFFFYLQLSLTHSSNRVIFRLKFFVCPSNSPFEVHLHMVGSEEVMESILFFEAKQIASKRTSKIALRLCWVEFCSLPFCFVWVKTQIDDNDRLHQTISSFSFTYSLSNLIFITNQNLIWVKCLSSLPLSLPVCVS